MVFDGVELLEFAVKSIRNQIHHISVTYQTISYFGNPADSNLIPILNKLKGEGLVDELIYFEPDLSLHHKKNEIQLRNIGLESSRRNGCTHHISADVDEFYEENQLEYAKDIMSKNNYDFSMAPLATYYKDPTFLVTPDQKLITSFIHPIDNQYQDTKQFPFPIETTRRLSNYKNYRIFNNEEITIHHMSYVRKDIRRKLQNSDNGRFYNIDKFVSDWEKYKLGDRVCLIPDFINRKTTKVKNIFGINF